jgi:hypothetical protein
VHDFVFAYSVTQKLFSMGDAILTVEEPDDKDR